MVAKFLRDAKKAERRSARQAKKAALVTARAEAMVIHRPDRPPTPVAPSDKEEEPP